MKRFLVFPTAGIFVITLLFAGTSLRGQNPWPDSWPAGMELRLTYGGGMRYYSSETVIRADSSYSLVNDGGREIRTALHFSQAQLDQLLSTLKDRGFYAMQSKPRPGIVYDMGTTSLRLSWNNKNWGVSIGASTELPDQYHAAYQAIRNHINELLARKK
ncbi:MAG: hypothetical protein NTW29_08530 [Bacteroidetes bacterium]|nr:hypothetical protein [Bacteroidota bacterium]